MMCIPSCTTILIFTLLGILLQEYALFKTRKIRAIDEARDSKYPSFRRTDTHLWKRWRLYLAAPILIPKMLLSILALAILLIGAQIVVSTAGLKKGEILQGWRLKLVAANTKYMTQMIVIFGAGLYWWKSYRPKVDYSKYLGPEWKPTYENPSTVITNH